MDCERKEICPDYLTGFFIQNGGKNRTISHTWQYVGWNIVESTAIKCQICWIEKKLWRELKNIYLF